MEKKWFTVEEANALLPTIREELLSLQAIKRQFEECYMQLRQLKEEASLLQPSAADEHDPFFARECELEFMQIEARTIVQSVHRKGVQLKDIDQGLVDFPSIRDGEEVLLCWRQGEEAVMHYHGWTEGFAGRKRIEDGDQ